MPGSASSAAVLKSSTNYSCASAAQVSTAMGATFGAPKKAKSFEGGEGVCTYKAATGAKSLVIAHSPVGKGTLKGDAKAQAGKGKLTAVLAAGTGAYYLTSSKLDFLMFEKGKVIYEIADYTLTASEAELGAVGGVVSA
jgi:hypothetical protein